MTLPTSAEKKYLAYRTDVINPDIPFTEGMSRREAEQLSKVLGGRAMTADEGVVLKKLTGCQTFTEFKQRLISEHSDVSATQSIIHIEELSLREDEERMRVTALIHTHDGSRLAAFDRALNWRTSSVYHHRLVVDGKWQSKGLGSALIQSHERIWRDAGYARIRLEAAKEDGKVYWALHGYDFDPEHDDQRRVTQKLLSLLEHGMWIARNITNEDGNDITRAIDARPLHSWEVAQIVVRRSDGSTYLLGEEALNERPWHGIKELNDAWPGNGPAAETRQRFPRPL